MAEPAPAWTARSAWAGLLAVDDVVPGREPGVVASPIEGMSLVSVVASADRRALAGRVGERLGAELPDTPRLVAAADVTLLWAGRNHWLALSESPDLHGRLRTALGDVAALSDQGASRALLRLTGASVRAALAKGCAVDLHPGAFAVGDVAVTVVCHLGVQIWRPDAESFVLACSRSYAGSFWSWLSASAAEFGLEVRAAREVSA